MTAIIVFVLILFHVTICDRLSGPFIVMNIYTNDGCGDIGRIEIMPLENGETCYWHSGTSKLIYDDGTGLITNKKCDDCHLNLNCEDPWGDSYVFQQNNCSDTPGSFRLTVPSAMFYYVPEGEPAFIAGTDDALDNYFFDGDDCGTSLYYQTTVRENIGWGDYDPDVCYETTFCHGDHTMFWNRNVATSGWEVPCIRGECSSNFVNVVSLFLVFLSSLLL